MAILAGHIDRFAQWISRAKCWVCSRNDYWFFATRRPDGRISELRPAPPAASPACNLQDGKDDHFGLRGIRERADRIGAKLAVRSRLGEGTEVEITVPGGIRGTKTAISFTTAA